MRFFLSYLLKSYCCTVITITIYILLGATIIYKYGNYLGEASPFSSPLLAVIICDLTYPIYNLFVIITLYKYRLSKIEIAIESIILVNIITYMDDFVSFFYTHMLTPIFYSERNKDEFLCWYNSSLNVIFGICITIVMCFIYIKIKHFVIYKTSIRD